MKKIFILLMLIVLVGCTSKEDRRDALLDNAKKLEQSERYAEAKIEARNALKLDPNFAEAYLLLGRCNMKEQDWRSAYGAFTRVNEINPANVEALQNLGRITLLAGDTDKATEYADKAMALAPKDIENKILRSGILLRTNQLDQAQSLLEGILKEQPQHEEAIIGLASVYINKKELTKAREILNTALAKTPDSAPLLNLLMNLAFQEKDYAAAEGYIKQMQVKFPENEGLAVRLADISLVTNKFEQALEYLTKYLETHPQAENVRVRLVELNVSKKQFDNALTILDKAPEATPNLRLVKATVFLQAGRVDDAITSLRALADDVKAGEPSAKAQLGLAEIYIQKKMPDEAIKELNALVQRNPGDLKAHALRGRLYIGKKQYEDAVADLRIVVRDDPKDNASALALAEAQNASGNSRLAEDTIKDVIKRAPEFSPSYLTLANLYLQQKKVDSALAALRSGKAKVTDNADLPFAEADILTSEKRYDEAAKVLDEVTGQEKFKLPALLRLAGLMGQKEDYAKAVDYFDQILAVNPDATLAAEGHIRATIAAGKPGDALAFAEKRQKERPEDPYAAALTGEAALAMQNIQKAETAFQRALELAPQWDQPLTRLAQIYTSTGRIDDAIAKCRDALKKTPDAAAPALLLALLQERKGDWKAAEDTYRNLLIKQPDLLLVANNLAYLLTQHNPDPARLKEAEDMAAKAATSEAPAALDTLGWIHHLQGKNADAEINLRKAHEGAADNPTITYHLTVVLAALDKKAEAKALLKELTEKEGDFPEKEDAKKLLKTL